MRWWSCSLAVLVVFTLAGCPGSAPSGSVPGGSDFDSVTPGGSTETPGGGSGGSGGGSTGGPTAGETTTGTDPTIFTDCFVAPQEAAWRLEILDLVNAERAAEGLNPVTWNSTLAEQADTYACEMVHYRFFDHVNPVTGSTLRDRAGQFGYDYLMIGENLAAGQRTPQQAMTDWMDSPGHRANILEPEFTELGVGIRLGGEYGYYWVQEFGRPHSAAATKPATAKPLAQLEALIP